MAKKRIISKKAQSAIEFTALVAFLLIFMVVVLFVLRNYFHDLNIARDEQKAREYFNIIDQEATLAESSPAIYTRDFYLPRTIDGFDVTLSCKNGWDVVMNYKGKEYVYFFTNMSCTNIDLGDNTISKVCPSSPTTRCIVKFEEN